MMGPQNLRPTPPTRRRRWELEQGGFTGVPLPSIFRNQAIKTQNTKKPHHKHVKWSLPLFCVVFTWTMSLSISWPDHGWLYSNACPSYNLALETRPSRGWMNMMGSKGTWPGKTLNRRNGGQSWSRSLSRDPDNLDPRHRSLLSRGWVWDTEGIFRPSDLLISSPLKKFKDPRKNVADYYWSLLCATPQSKWSSVTKLAVYMCAIVIVVCVICDDVF